MLRVESKLGDRTERVLSAIIGAAIEVHRLLGPGYLEKVYESALAVELRTLGIPFESQLSVPVFYKNVEIRQQVLDMVVCGAVVLELKSVSHLTAAHEAQLLSYLKSTRLQVGLLLNFNQPTLKEGLKRVVN